MVSQDGNARLPAQGILATLHKLPGLAGEIPTSDFPMFRSTGRPRLCADQTAPRLLPAMDHALIFFLVCSSSPPIIWTFQVWHSPLCSQVADWPFWTAARIAKHSTFADLNLRANATDGLAIVVFRQGDIAPSNKRPHGHHKAFDLQQHLLPRIGGFSGDARTGCGLCICIGDSIRIAAASA